MTDPPPRADRADRADRMPTAARVAAVVVAVVTTVGTSLTWRTTVTRTAGPAGHPAWTSGAWAATGATLAVLGVVVLVAATFVRRRAWAIGAGGALAVAGAATLLAERYRPVDDIVPVTVAIGRFTTGPDPVVGVLPDATAWVTAGGLGALVVVAAAFPARVGRPRLGTAVAAVGAVLLIVGASAFPWTSGLSSPTAVDLWRAGGDAVTGGVMLVVAALALVVTVRRPVRGATVAAALVAAGGLGVVLPLRLPNPWGDRITGWYAYQPLETVSIPAAWRFQAATTLVLLGAVLVLVGAVAAARHQGRSATSAAL